MLKAHGWKVVPGGTTTCAKAGTASDECGAGIPVGTPISFVWANLPESASTTGALESEAVVVRGEGRRRDQHQLSTKTFNFLTANYNDQNPAAAKYTNDWGVNNYGGIYQDYYPTQEGIQSPVNAGFNLGVLQRSDGEHAGAAVRRQPATRPRWRTRRPTGRPTCRSGTCRTRIS